MRSPWAIQTVAAPKCDFRTRSGRPCSLTASTILDLTEIDVTVRACGVHENPVLWNRYRMPRDDFEAYIRRLLT